MKIFTTLLWITLLSYSTLMGVEYQVDEAKSSVNFKVRHLMFSNVDGHFARFNGSYDYDASTQKVKALTGVVELASVSTADSKRDAYIKADDFFNVKKYPTMRLEFVGQEGNVVLANLTIKEVTKGVTLEIKELTDANNVHRGLELKGTLNRKDFGLSFGLGDISVGKEVSLDLILEKS